MAKATFRVLSEKDKQLVLETEPKKLAKLDEDELIELHARVRRARNRHTKLYRQQAAGKVKSNRRRAGASASQARDRARAEVLEDALARVSRRLAAAARASADALKTERLAAAKGAKAKPTSGAKAPAKKKSKPAGTAKANKKRRTPASEKKRASAKGSTKRTQAKRDGRR
jgi:phytoene dehydrogenase-like protein